MSFEKLLEKELNTPKFAAKQNTYIFTAQPAPYETSVDGKYGKQVVYVMNTKELGLVYLSKTQFIKVAQAMAAAGWAENIGVEI